MTPLDAAWHAVISAPDDDAALRVLADALMERGDPHGELIRLQLAGDEAGAKDHLAKHATNLLGTHDLWTTRFARGFLSSVRLETVAEFEALVQRPVARLLREVRVMPGATIGTVNDPIDRLVNALVANGPRTITTVSLEADTDNYEDQGEVKVESLTARFPSLARLSIAWTADFARAASASLRELRLNLAYRLQRLEHARFPELTALELELPYRVLSLPGAFLSSDTSPKLETLTLRGTLWPQFLHELTGSSLLRRLRRLEIGSGGETAWYPALLERAASFAHLDHLALVADRHHPEWVSAVKTALPQARILSAPLRFFIP